MNAGTTIKKCCCGIMDRVDIEEGDIIEVCRRCGGARLTGNLAGIRDREAKRRDNGNS